MLLHRRFNIVYDTKEKPQPLNLQNPQGQLVDYSGKALTIEL
jgi:hypothetical protein